MKEVKPKEMMVNQTYYIQSEVGSGNGRQKGVFIEVYYTSSEFPWAIFEKVDNFTEIGSGYATGTRWFRCDLCKFYLPEKEAMVERVMVNAVLREITGDPSFFFYPVVKKPCSILLNNWISEKDITLLEV
jgi:hypothetical protein